MNIKDKKINVLKILIVVFLLVNIVGPLVAIGVNLFKVDIREVYSSNLFKSALSNSLKYTLIATFISTTLSFILAYLIRRTTIKFKTIFSIVLTLPMLIPSISHGTGILLLFGQNGILTNLFGIKGSVYGMTGLVLGSVMYSFPVAFLMFNDILSYEDLSIYDAADILGIPKKSQFARLFTPYILKSLITVIFAVFTLIFTDYGVPIMVGGRIKTLPLYMYEEVLGLLNYGKGIAIGLVLLVPAVIAFILDILVKENNTSTDSNQKVKSTKVKNAIAYSVIGITIFLIMLPIFSFVFLTFITKYPIDLKLTFANIERTFHYSAGKYLLNSLFIAVTTSLIGTLIAYLSAYLTSRTKAKSNKFIHLLSMLSLAIPGILLGISYMLFFKSSFIYGTFVILILVNVIHFFGSPYIMAYNALNKMNKNYEMVGETLGVGRLRLIKDVFIPSNKNTILEMFSYFFVNSMITISAVSFLATSSNKPLSLMIEQFEMIQLMESAAFVSLMILFVNSLLKLTIYLIKRKGQKNEIIKKSV